MPKEEDETDIPCYTASGVGTDVGTGATGNGTD